MGNLKKALLEVVAAGLPPEDAALVLLEPSRWDKDLFGPGGDLKTIYKSYLRGEIGVGRLFDAASDIASAADAMAEMADSISREYGDDARPQDVPEDVQEKDRVSAEDETVEVLTGDPDDPSVILEQVRQLFQQPLSTQDVHGIEKKLLGSIQNHLATLWSFMRDARQAYKGQDWANLAALYNELQFEAQGVAGDLMVLRDFLEAATEGGYGDIQVGQLAQRLGGQAYEALDEADNLVFYDRDLIIALNRVSETLRNAAAGGMTYEQLQAALSPDMADTSPIMQAADIDWQAAAAQVPARPSAQAYAEPPQAAQEPVAEPAALPGPPAPAEVPQPTVVAPEPTQAEIPAPAEKPAAPVVQMPQAPEQPQPTAGPWDPSGQQAQNLMKIGAFHPAGLQAVLGGLQKLGMNPRYVTGIAKKAMAALERERPMPGGMQAWLSAPENARVRNQLSKRLNMEIRKLVRGGPETGGTPLIEWFSEEDLVKQLQQAMALAIPA